MRWWLVRSWVDHANHNLTIMSEVTRVLLGSNLCDHHSLAFSLNGDCFLVYIPPQTFSFSLSLDWDKASREDYRNFSNLVANFTSSICCLLLFTKVLLTSCLLNCAFSAIPSHRKSKHKGLAGWNNGNKKLRCETNLGILCCLWNKETGKKEIQICSSQSRTTANVSRVWQVWSLFLRYVLKSFGQY